MGNWVLRVRGGRHVGGHSVACDTEVPVEEGMIEDWEAIALLRRWVAWADHVFEDDPAGHSIDIEYAWQLDKVWRESRALIEGADELAERMAPVLQWHAEIAAAFPVAMVGED